MDDNFDVLQLEHDDDDPERAGNLNPVQFWRWVCLWPKLLWLCSRLKSKKRMRRNLKRGTRNLWQSPGLIRQDWRFWVQLTASCALQAGALELSIFVFSELALAIQVRRENLSSSSHVTAPANRCKARDRWWGSETMLQQFVVRFDVAFVAQWDLGRLSASLPDKTGLFLVCSLFYSLIVIGLQIHACSKETLNTFFALFDNCIQLYRLNKPAT